MFNLGLKHAIALRKLTGTVCSLFYKAAETCAKVKCDTYLNQESNIEPHRLRIWGGGGGMLVGNFTLNPFDP